MRRLSIFFIIFVQSCSLLAALSADEKPLTLEKALQTAKANSLSLYTEDKNLDTAESAYKARFSALYPAITGTGTLSRSIVGLTDTDSVSLSSGLSASLTLNPALKDGIKYLKQAYASAGLEQQEAEKALERDVKVSFYNLLYTGGTIELNRKSMETLKGEYNLALADYKNGRISELELLTTQVAYKNMEPVIAGLLTSYREQRSQFFLLLGIENNGELQLEGRIELPENSASITRQTPDLDTHFDVAALDNSIAEAEISLDSTLHQGYYPSIVMGAGFSETAADPLSGATWDTGFTDPWTDTTSFSLTVSIPIDSWLPGSTVRTSVTELENSLAVLGKQRSQAVRTAAAEISLLYDNLDNSLLNLESLKLSLTVAERAYQLTEEGYRHGTQEFLALQEAEDDLNSARQNLLAEKLDYLTTLFDLEYALNTNTAELLR